MEKLYIKDKLLTNKIFKKNWTNRQIEKRLSDKWLNIQKARYRK